MPKRIDITGERYGKLVAVRYSYTSNSKKAVWECKCDCGKTHYVTAKDLRSGNTKSCGCSKVEIAKRIKYKDGRCKDRLYKVWNTMLKRCYCTTAREYKYYGAKGIVVCEQWRDYGKFKEWACKNGYDENAPRGECTIDRIDCSGNYEPSNCRWVSMEVQLRNKSHGENPYRNPFNGRYESKPIELNKDILKVSF